MNCEAIALLKNKYHLYAAIGQGELHSTFWATESASGKPVIIKTLSCSLREHPDYDTIKQQFLNLAQRLASCQHRHLVAILDSFEDEGQPYIVYEYIPGQTLEQLIEFGLVLPQTQALRAICQIGAALCVLHNAGLQHLDINPKNIILRKDTNDVVLIDFGFPLNLLKDASKNASYHPPEQLNILEDCTPATDIYALAATLYYLLVGNPPPLPSERSSGWHIPHKFSSAVKTVISQGLALNPQQRPSTIKNWLSPLFSKNRSASSQSSNQVTENNIIEKKVVDENNSLQTTEAILTITRESIEEKNIANEVDAEKPRLQDVQLQDKEETSISKSTNFEEQAVKHEEPEVVEAISPTVVATEEILSKKATISETEAVEATTLNVPETKLVDEEEAKTINLELSRSAVTKEILTEEVTITETQTVENEEEIEIATNSTINATATQEDSTTKLAIPESEVVKETNLDVSETQDLETEENVTSEVKNTESQTLETIAVDKLETQEVKLTEAIQSESQQLEVIPSENPETQETTATESTEILTSEATSSKLPISETITEEILSPEDEKLQLARNNSDFSVENNLVTQTNIFSNVRVVSHPAFSTSTSSFAHISKKTHGFPFHLNLKNFSFPQLHRLEFLHLQNLKNILPQDFSLRNFHSQEEKKASENSVTPQAKFLIGSMLVTSAISTSAGIGFGLAIRLNRPAGAGSTPLHTEQSFPPRPDWSPSESPKTEMSNFPPRDEWPISNSVEINIP